MTDSICVEYSRHDYGGSLTQTHLLIVTVDWIDDDTEFADWLKWCARAGVRSRLLDEEPTYETEASDCIASDLAQLDGGGIDCVADIIGSRAGSQRARDKIGNEYV